MSGRTDLVKHINGVVNARVRYVSDPEKYHTDEWWADACANGDEGDCDDYAVAKMRKLLDAGIPQADMRYMFTLTEPFMIDGRMATPAERGHCVLIVSMIDGDLMLDNRQPLPVPVTEIEALGYEPIFIQRVGGEPGWAPYGGVKALEAA